MNKLYVVLNSDNVPELDDGIEVVCADGGKKYYKGKPLCIIGDFDSFSKENDCDTEKIVYPEKKNLSDGFLCLNWAVNKGYSEVVFCGVSGGRLDHQLSNLSLLKMAKEKGINAIGYDKVGYSYLNIYYATSPISIKANEGDIISVMPFDQVTIDSGKGVEYPFKKTTLSSSDLSRGLSNVAMGDVKLNIVSGACFIFHYFSV